MKGIIRYKGLVLAVWLLAVAALMLTAPNMQQLVRDKGQLSVPDGYSSVQASQLLSEMNGPGSGPKKTQSTILVFHGEGGLDAAQLEDIRQGVEKLKNNKDQLGVASVLTHFDMPELASQAVSADGSTVLALLEVSLDGRSPEEARSALHEALQDVKVDHYLTGNWLIQEDVVKSSQEGLHKTEWITVVFILAILFVVFRSAFAPFLPLVTIGISYLASQSIVAYLVKYLDFPLSTFTQIFLVAIMFGIGTDYCILLISRFKEELAHGRSRVDAILATYRTAGRTVLFSGIAVFVGFACIGFSSFSLFRSGVAVAVGVAVLMLALFTFVPFLLASMGGAIFWPSRKALEHKPNRVWGAVGGFAYRRPLIALLILAVVIAPLLSFYRGAVSFDSMEEIGGKYDSVKAFNYIADGFGPGDSLPTTVVVKADQPFDSAEGLALVEKMTRELAQVDGVKIVRSATRPTGDPLADLQVANQVGQLDSGLGQGADGVDQIADGLKQAGDSLASRAPQLQSSAEGAEQLASGTRELEAGLGRLGDGLKRIEQGLRDGTAGADQLEAGLAQAQASAEQLAAASAQLQGQYEQLGAALGELTTAYGKAAASQQAFAQGLGDVSAGLGGLAQKYPELQQDEDFLQAQSAIGSLQQSAEASAVGLEQLNAQLAGFATGLGQANAGLDQAAGGQAELAKGLKSLATGLAELADGLGQSADGQSQIVTQLPELTSGAAKLAEGQEQLADGVKQLNDQLGELTDGLQDSASGLAQVSGGLKSAQSYLGELSGASDKQLSGWFVPDEALGNADFQAALGTYLSEDRTIAKLEVIFTGNPYDVETLDRIEDVREAALRSLKVGEYAGAQVEIGGVTSLYHDLDTVSSKDYRQTVIFMIAGIGLILLVLFRSLVIPLYLIVSLLATYYTSMAATELIFTRMLDYSGTSWVIPFFGFVMLMALGVDYSIFLMDRFKEYRHLPPREAILSAMSSMGTVILSAAVILGGTFAAMLPAGVLSLMQIAVTVLCGLFLYAIAVLPLFIPMMVRLFGEANWWPFMGRRGERGERLEAPPETSQTFGDGI
ncbi:MMPL family transporter [Cohnella lubricantis]|uniref:MMPL family transporter n=1 Tax=Cohnella lubricantis TaxID=2163172 RepID=A0A841T9J1_9BACL|nr:MMPL family transporter [Cohnella lubricantis]MBB6676695.1 MMPL family transporter [Cohnella lubricantis]MBP2117741.1 RND superfamily putative drug exporter [Cohnella lubricantis]